MMLFGRFATVQTELSDTLHLISMTGDEALGRPFAYTLELSSENPHIDLDEVLGTTICVTMELGLVQVRHFHGIVISFARVPNAGRFACYKAVIRPWLWLLSRVFDCRIFQRTTVPDVIKLLFREHGFSYFSDALVGTYPVREYIVQYRESTLEFVTRLMEREGIYYYFTHSSDQHELVLSDSYGAHELVPGHEQIEYHEDLHHEQLRERDYLSSWTVAHALHPGKLSLTDYDFERPRADLSRHVLVPGPHPHGEYERYDYPGGYLDLGEGDVRVRTRLEALHVERRQIVAVGNVRALFTGSLFVLEEHPREDQCVEHLVISSHFRLTNNPLESSGVGEGASYHSTLRCIPSDVPFRLNRRTAQPRVGGPQTAVVVGPAGEEIWTDQYGRVKIQFHWDRLGNMDENSSCWIRVAEYWAGSGFGGIHLPRIGQEVIVDFLEGDPDRPIVVGRVYNANNMPPYELPTNATQSGWKSRSSKGGDPSNFNEIRFEDKKGSEEVFMQAEKDMNTNVKHNQSVTVGADRTKTIGANETVTVKKDRTETVHQHETVTVDGNQTIHVKGSHSFAIDGTAAPGGKPSGMDFDGGKVAVTGDYKMETSKTVEVKAPDSITLAVGSTSIEILPDKITLQVGNGAKLVLDTDVLATSQAGSKVLLDAEALCQASGGAKVLLNDKVLNESTAGTTVTLGPDLAAAATLGATLTLDTGVSASGLIATVEGQVSAELKTVANSVKTDPATVTIMGTMVKIN